MNDIQLSENFWLREFLRSETAARMGREIKAGEFERDNLSRLCRELLQPIRSGLGRVITVTSGLRPVWLNTQIRGSKTSAHIYAMAADFIVAGMTPRQTCEWIVQHQAELPFQQLILEYDQWVHISSAPAGMQPKREVLTWRYRNEKVEILSGLH